MDETILNDAVRYAHLLCVAGGLGAACAADVAALSDLRKPISARLFDMLLHLHRIIWPALFGMWLTGLWPVYLRTGFVLDAFSAKLSAKLIVVILLTINALMISRIALPMLARNRGRLFCELNFRQQIMAACVAGVSTASWLLALAMGSSKRLASEGPDTFLALLPCVYAVAVAISLIILRVFARPHAALAA